MSIIYIFLTGLACGVFALVLRTVLQLIEKYFNGLKQTIAPFSIDVILLPVAIGIIGFFAGLILAFINLFSNSIIISIVISFAFSLLESSGSVKSALEIYNRSENFNRQSFISEVFSICSTLIIFPLLSVLAWILKINFLTNK